MPKYEYKVIPAPRRGQRAKGLRGTEQRFAHMIETIMNEQGADGWEYLRADSLPCEERQGLTRKTVVEQNLLVFRRLIPAPLELAETMRAAAPAPGPAAAAAPAAAPAAETAPEAAPEPAPEPEPENPTPSIEGVVRSVRSNPPPLGGAVRSEKRAAPPVGPLLT